MLATHVLHRLSTAMKWSVISITMPNPAARSLVDAWTAVEWEHLTLFHFAVVHASQIFYTMWYQIWEFLIQCVSLSASLKIGPEILDKSLAASWLQVVTYPCCSCLSMKLEVKTLFLRCKLWKTPHKAPVLGRISDRQFSTEMPVIRSHVESGVAMESICV